MKMKKGMSQILVLIVAAAVMMMVGLLLISLSSGSITDAFSNTNAAACQRSIESQCRTQGTVQSAPATCSNVNPSQVTGLTSSGVDCNQVLN